jgi:hypothetical protein
LADKLAPFSRWSLPAAGARWLIIKNLGRDERGHWVRYPTTSTIICGHRFDEGAARPAAAMRAGLPFGQDAAATMESLVQAGSLARAAAQDPPSRSLHMSVRLWPGRAEPVDVSVVQPSDYNQWGPGSAWVGRSDHALFVAAILAFDGKTAPGKTECHCERLHTGRGAAIAMLTTQGHSLLS